MAQEGRTALKTYFETGDIPTEAQFINLIDSILNITDDDSDDLTEGVTKLLMTVAERASIAFNALGTFDGSLIELSTSGSYTALTMSADLLVTFAESGHVAESVHLVDITADGTDTLTFVRPSAYALEIPLSLTNGANLASGKHQLVILFTPGVINVQLNARQNVAAVIPTVSSMTVEDAEPNQLVFNFSEACTGTEQGIDFEVDNVDRSITYLSGSGTTSIIFTISGAAILNTDTLTAALTSGDLAAVAVPQNSVADFTEDTVTNNVASISIILLQDDFAGVTIDTGKWTITNPDNPSPIISQNNELIGDSDTGATSALLANNLLSILTFTGKLSVQYFHALPTGAGAKAGGWTNYFYIDNDNRIGFAALTSAATTPYEQRCIIRAAAVNELVLETGIGADDKWWKIEISATNVIKFYYHLLASGSWVQVGDVGGYTFDIGTVKNLLLGFGNSGNVYTAGMDNVYVTNDFYTTEIPV